MDKGKLNNRFKNFELPFDDSAVKSNVFKNLDQCKKEKSRKRFFWILFPLIGLALIGISLGIQSDMFIQESDNNSLTDTFEKIASQKKNTSQISKTVEAGLTSDKLDDNSRNQHMISKADNVNSPIESKGYRNLNLQQSSKLTTVFTDSYEFINSDNIGGSNRKDTQFYEKPLRSFESNIIPPISSATHTTNSFQASNSIGALPSIKAIDLIKLLVFELPSNGAQDFKWRVIERDTTLQDPTNTDDSLYQYGFGLAVALGSKKFSHTLNYNSKSPTDTTTMSTLSKGMQTYELGILFQHKLMSKWTLEHSLGLNFRLSNYIYDYRNVKVSQTEQSVQPTYTNIITSNIIRSRSAQFIEQDLELFYRPRLLRSFALTKRFKALLGAGTSLAYDIKDSYYSTDSQGGLVTIDEYSKFYLRSIDLTARLSYQLPKQLVFSLGGTYMHQFSAIHKVYQPDELGMQIEMMLVRRF